MIKIVTMFILCLFLTGCIGLTGTKVSVTTPEGVNFEYATDDSKELNGFEIIRAADGWRVSLDKSNSTPTETMANALLNMSEVMNKRLQ
jgi:hypothetical protein